MAYCTRGSLTMLSFCGNFSGSSHLDTLYRQLILVPQVSQWTCADLPEQLRQLGLLSVAVTPARANRYLIGNNFLQQINFMGCAPAIEFEPSAQDDLLWNTFIFIMPCEFSQPRWCADLDMAKPACPHCKKRITQTATHLDSSTLLLTCPHCTEQNHVCAFDWKEYGGCAKTMVVIANVYPKEAIPTDSLLTQLENLTGTAWRYFYFNGPLV
jgi:hypothetical protein